MTDKEFMQWIFDRLVHKYGESPYYDYMHRFARIIGDMPDVDLVRWKEAQRKFFEESL